MSLTMQQQENQTNESPSLPLLFTEADERCENATLTYDEVVSRQADLYGLASSLSNCDVSEDDYLPEALYMLDKELEEIPRERKAAILEAQEKCPELVDDRCKEAFLWAEDLDAEAAAKRMVNYWEYKRELFGPGRCFLPMTLDGALKNDVDALSALRQYLLPVKDKAGRAILFAKGGPDYSRYNHESLVRAQWYMFHTAIEDSDVQKRGLVALILPEMDIMKQFHAEQQRFIRKSFELIRCFPLKTRAQHVIHPSLLGRFILGFGKLFMGKTLRQRLEIHAGSEKEVLQSLERFGFVPNQLPTDIGGTVVVDIVAWKAHRAALERHRSSPTSAPPSQMPKHHDVQSLNQCGVSRPSETGGILTLEQLRSADSLGLSPFGMQSKQNISKGGRKGDPRMNKAVKASLDDPNLTLLDALLAGGFTFPANPGTLGHKPVVDSDGVLLAQRKNQLNRRLRSFRKKMGITSSSAGSG